MDGEQAGLQFSEGLMRFAERPGRLQAAKAGRKFQDEDRPNFDKAGINVFGFIGGGVWVL